MSNLHERLLDAHARDDRTALVDLYTQAADAENDVDAACFFLTHAFVFALELGDQRADDLRARLRAHNRV